MLPIQSSSVSRHESMILQKRFQCAPETSEDMLVGTFLDFLGSAVHIFRGFTMLIFEGLAGFGSLVRVGRSV